MEEEKITGKKKNKSAEPKYRRPAAKRTRSLK